MARDSQIIPFLTVLELAGVDLWGTEPSDALKVITAFAALAGSNTPWDEHGDLTLTDALAHIRDPAHRWQEGLAGLRYRAMREHRDQCDWTAVDPDDSRQALGPHPKPF